MTNRQKIKKILTPIVESLIKEGTKNLYTASMNTRDGVLNGYIKYNDYQKKFEVGTDDDFVDQFKTEKEAVDELKNMGFKNIKKVK